MPEAAPLPALLATEEREALLWIARRSIARATGAHANFEAVPLPAGTLGAPGCAFVTLTVDGDLRGCIGSLAPDIPLAEAVESAAASAAVRDPRFAPVRAGELPGLHMEISVLGDFAPLAAPADFEAGVHGVLVVVGGRRGIFLPEVATEMGWDATEMLDAVCAKAGLPRSAWHRPDAGIWCFRTERFGGPVTPR